MKRKLQVLLAILAVAVITMGCGTTPAGPTEKTEATKNKTAFTDDAKVSYLGPEGTYTEEAAKLFFPASNPMMPKETVADAIADVVTGTTDYAVIPQENTIGGVVTDYADALIAQEDIYVVGEVILPISQTLMGVPGATIEDIKEVRSHAQGIAQSEKWRKENLPNVTTKEMDSTAAAASYVAKTGDKSIAAIAAPGAADFYGLSVLATDVQLSDANKTRFYVLSSSEMTAPEKTHAVFVASCPANEIDDIIIAIHEAGLEPVAIHDRPEGTMLGSYNYIIEAENEKGISEKDLEKISTLPHVRFIGSFDSIEKKTGDPDQ